MIRIYTAKYDKMTDAMFQTRTLKTFFEIRPLDKDDFDIYSFFEFIDCITQDYVCSLTSYPNTVSITAKNKNFKNNENDVDNSIIRNYLYLYCLRFVFIDSNQKKLTALTYLLKYEMKPNSIDFVSSSSSIFGSYEFKSLKIIDCGIPSTSGKNPFFFERSIGQVKSLLLIQLKWIGC